jgi:hypothetical protein
MPSPKSMAELKIPVPIRTLGARVTIEGELPGFRHGVAYPTWDAADSGSLWGGAGTLEGPPWESGRSYSVDDVVEKGGLVFLANDPIAAGEDPFLGDESGGNVASTLAAYSSTGGRQLFAVSTPVTCTGVSLWGYNAAGGFGMKHGYRVALSDGTPSGGTQNYDGYVKLTEGTFQGSDFSEGWQHIPFTHPVKLSSGTYHQILHDGNDSANPSAVMGATFGGAILTPPVGAIGDWFTSSTGYGGAFDGSNADTRMVFKLWTTPWDLQAAGIPAVTREPRFLIYVGPSGMDLDSITDDMMTEVSAVDPTYVGPSSFGGTGPGVARHCFRVKDIIPATPTNFQSLYIKYAPTNIPAGAPNGVAVYNVTAEAYVPGYALGEHSTSARFY